MFLSRFRTIGWALALSLAAAGLAVAADEASLTPDQIKAFLLNAKVISSKHTSKGVTAPWRLTLSDGNLTHDGSFQAIDEHKTNMQFSGGRTEMNFVDSYHYNIAAYELARLVGLENMIPVYVERKWNGMTGSLSWWLPVKMDEGERLKQGLQPPDPDAWNKQMYKKRVFAQLVYDSDPNLTNLLIGETWQIWMIDFTRGFRLYKELENAKNLTHCDRNLLEKLRQLNESEVMEKTRPHLKKNEVQAVMARRDKIVQHFQKLVAEQGEAAVLY